MHLPDLLAGVAVSEVRGDLQVDISSVTHDSRRVDPGALFCCVPGARADGHDFAPAAVAAGAAALLVERPLTQSVTEVVVPRVRDVMGPLAAAFHGHPSAAMTVIGVTGTNGKTTTTYLLETVARAAGLAAGVVGTVEARIRGLAVPGAFTTPEAPDLQALLARMRREGVMLVAMEVSSHGLHFGRVDGTRFAVACFRNLSHDHLDLHGSLEAYFEAKATLFRPERAARACVNVSDPWGVEIWRRCVALGLDAVTYGIEGAAAEGSDVVPDVGVGMEATPHMVRAPRWDLIAQVRAPYLGVLNAAAAAASALAAHLPTAAVGEMLESVIAVPGRFERVEGPQDFTVVVDYAHTAEAIEHVLRTARHEAGEGRVLVVFGCGGDRDRAKRPVMGEAAARHADAVYVTSDNPRSEDPLRIIDEILAGMRSGSPPVVEPDRRAAIARALADARPGDVVVVAGKGHETTQTVGEELLPFDDRVVVREELEALRCA